MNGLLAKTAKKVAGYSHYNGLLKKEISKCLVSLKTSMNSGKYYELLPKHRSPPAVSETVMWGLDKEPKKTESALHKGEKLHNRACNTWSNKPVIDAFQTME